MKNKLCMCLVLSMAFVGCGVNDAEWRGAVESDKVSVDMCIDACTHHMIEHVDGDTVASSIINDSLTYCVVYYEGKQCCGGHGESGSYRTARDNHGYDFGECTFAETKGGFQ